MRSFRKRLLVLIIGLAVLTQTVTLFAVLASTARGVEARGAEQLSAAGAFVDQLIRYRAEQLANGVAILAEDFGFREAVASGDGPTMLSAAGNNARRIGADLVLLLDTQGRVLASNAPSDAHVGASIEGLLLGNPGGRRRNRSQFMVLGRRTYQFFVAPVRTPEIIAWVAMGFTVDDALARRIRDLAGAQVTLGIREPTGFTRVASSLPEGEQSALPSESAALARVGGNALVMQLGDTRYLTFAQRIDSRGDTVEAILQKPIAAVFAPYRALRNSLLLIDGAAVVLAALIGMILGRSATRPLGELVRAAERIQHGRYDRAVAISGGEEFRSLAATFNTMQRTIADREADITRHAFYDSPTGLPNRALAERRLEDLLLGPERPAALALILILVRSVRAINATFGHEVGDEVVREAARRLSRNLAAEHLVARLAESQFLIIAPGFSAERARIYVDQLAGALRGGFHLSGMTLDLGVTAGLCVYPEHGRNAQELLRRVQVALEDAGDDRLRVTTYEPGRDEQHRRRLTLITGLRTAIDRDELALKYQPKVEVATGRVKSLEALVRWQHAALGAVSPGEFVPLAERAGASRALTNWVLGAAIRQLGEWRRDGLQVQLAVNLSAPDILDPDLGDGIMRLLADRQVEPAALLLEITESAVMRDPELAVRHMQPLRAAGVQFAIDDFGTGHSSLSLLNRLPVDELKIDRSFITQALSGQNAAAIVASTVALAHAMGLNVVAEGVETPEAWNLLKRLRCDCAQGYLISRPIDAAAVTEFVRHANDLLPASDSTVMQIRALETLTGGGKA